MAKSSTATQQSTLQTHAKYERLIARAKGVESAKTLIVHPCDETSLRGALEAAEAGLIRDSKIVLSEWVALVSSKLVEAHGLLTADRQSSAPI